MYPRFSETFIISEILALERVGFKIDIFSLRAPIDGRFHRFLSDVTASVTYLDPHPTKALRLWETIHTAGEQNARLWSVLQQARDQDVDEIYQAMLLSQHISDRNINHLHAHFASISTRVSSLAAQICGITHSFTAHAKDIYHESVDRGGLNACLEQASFSVTVSEYNQVFLNEWRELWLDSLHRIYNGLDLNVFKPSPSTIRGQSIVAVGRLVEKKGFCYLIEACALLKAQGREIHCLIVGTGPEEAMLHTLIQRLDMQDLITLSGPQTQDEVIAAVSHASMFVAPCIVGSDGNRDGLPTVLLEAMALGTPCISTDVTGIPELIRHGETGLLVPQKDVASLAKAIEILQSNHHLREILSTNARTLIEREFDIDKNVQHLGNLFRNTIDSQKSLSISQ